VKLITGDVTFITLWYPAY